MQNNLWIKTVKPIIKDEEPNKYVLEAVKSRDPVMPPFRACKGHMTYFLNFGNPSITFELKKLDISLFLNC